MFYAKDTQGMPRAAKFGTQLGIAPPGVPAYSCDYDTADDRQHGSYRASWNGVYTGYKYQCVEYARRWLVMAWGVTFLDVHMAYEIFDLPFFVRLRDKARLPLVRTKNGTVGARPRRGSVIMWQEGGFFKHTGHVAIVVDADDEKILIAEQNVTDAIWTSPTYARALPVTIGPKGEYTVQERYRNSFVLGWLNLPEELITELEAEQATARVEQASNVQQQRRAAARDEENSDDDD